MRRISIYSRLTADFIQLHFIPFVFFLNVSWGFHDAPFWDLFVKCRVLFEFKRLQRSNNRHFITPSLPRHVSLVYLSGSLGSHVYPCQLQAQLSVRVIILTFEQKPSKSVLWYPVFSLASLNAALHISLPSSSCCLSVSSSHYCLVYFCRSGYVPIWAPSLSLDSGIGCNHVILMTAEFRTLMVKLILSKLRKIICCCSPVVWEGPHTSGHCSWPDSVPVDPQVFGSDLGQGSVDAWATNREMFLHSGLFVQSHFCT